eukprot:29536_1
MSTERLSQELTVHIFNESTKRNYVYDLNTSAARIELLKYCLHQCCDHDEDNIPRFQEVVAKILSFELINVQHDLYYTLSTIYSKLTGFVSSGLKEIKHDTVTVWFCKLDAIVCLIMFNNLIFKRLFKSKNVDLWKIIVMLSVFLLQNDYTYPVCLVFPIGTIPYWKEKHFKYAIECGLGWSVLNQFNAPIANNIDESYISACPKMFAAIVMPVIKLGINKCKNSNELKNALLSKIGKIMNICSNVSNENKDANEYEKLMELWYNMIHDFPPENTFKNNVAYDLKHNVYSASCGWPLCRKNAETFRKCSQCKSIRYCSRNCQKKHWKFMHSKQCKFMT